MMTRYTVIAAILLSTNQVPVVADHADVSGNVSHGWKGWYDEGPIHSYGATIQVPLGEPAGAGQGTFGWAGVQSQHLHQVDCFTQIGFYWAPGANYTPPPGYGSFPVGQPIVFAWTDYNDDPSGGTWRLGPQLSPGQVLAVRIVTVTPGAFLDQYRTSHGWVTLANAAFTGPYVWSTEAESYGPPVPVTFLSRSYALARGSLQPLPRGTVTAP